jgi:hypothetical protein
MGEMTVHGQDPPVHGIQARVERGERGHEAVRLSAREADLKRRVVAGGPGESKLRERRLEAAVEAEVQAPHFCHGISRPRARFEEDRVPERVLRNADHHQQREEADATIAPSHDHLDSTSITSSPRENAAFLEEPRPRSS